MKAAKLLNKKFGKLKVLKEIGKDKRKQILWECLCDCGNKKIVTSNSLLSESVKSCGCLNHCLRRKWYPIGYKTNYITIIGAGLNERKDAKYDYICICGKIRRAFGASIKKIRSCGCGGKAYQGISGNYWNSIKIHAKQRNLKFELTIQEIWELFLKQQGKCALSGVKIILSRKPQIKTASLDRIDSSKGYVIDNVQWIHKELQIIKWDFAEDKLLDWCKKIVSYKKEINEQINTSSYII